MTYAWLEAGRPIVHGPWSLPTGVRVADALGSFLFIVWAVNTRMLFASSWGKVKLALGSEASSERKLVSFAKRCLFHLLNFSRCSIGCLTYVWSIKYRLITKLIAQLATNLRDESFKPN